ncbi:MAG: class F sortase, partial [Longispora sp.]|nr:class F sortase [Longispora sp. (in: high G+C Gram-positive bacteria)]
TPSAKPDPPLSLPASEPVRIDIPAIDIRAPIQPLGVQGNGEVETPPLDKAHLTGWYKLGPTPGEIGSSVILGHVDTWRTGSAVFFNLGALKQDQVIEVTRKDGTIATFVISGVASYPKDKFPTREVYGSDDTAQLRLVTCGGTFNTKIRSYTDNIVVFATLRSSRIATPADAERPLRTWIPNRQGRR